MSYRTPFKTLLSVNRSRSLHTIAATVGLFAGAAAAETVPARVAETNSVRVTLASLNLDVRDLSEGPARTAPVGLAAAALIVRRRTKNRRHVTHDGHGG